MKHALTILLLVISSLAATAQTGSWRVYLSYYEPTEIVRAGSNLIYVLASGDLYSYNQSDQSLQTYDKTTVLNDCDISHIAWCSKVKRLVIVYNNGNIDLLEQNSNVINIADYASAMLTGDKTVNGIYVYGANAYLATGFGVVQVNVADGTVVNTYNLGFNVNYTYIDGNYLYAASSSNGLYRGLLTDNLLDTSNWTRVGNYTASDTAMDPDLLALVKTLKPGGPRYNHFGFMRFKNNRLYTVPGGYTVMTDQSYPGAIQILDGDGNWNVYDTDNVTETTGVSFLDITNIDINPKDTSNVFVAGRNGLYEFRNGQFYRLYNHSNSPIESAINEENNPDYQLVLGSAFDADGHLWVLNSQAPTQSVLEYADGEWKAFKQSSLMKFSGRYGSGRSLGLLKAPFFDSRNLLWFVNDYWQIPSFYCLQPSTGGFNSYTTFVNEDGTTVEVTNVRCIAEDADNNIWIGTNSGPMLLTASDIANQSTTLTQVKVPRNDGTNYADYLLYGVDISCIAVDKANRKWLGTNGAGVYCIGSDNITEVHHFTADNSKLLSDNIESIAISDATGEVFFGTDKGLCSYMSNANTAAEGMTKSTVWAYPNPVRPEYVGAITITGLDEDADVKIVTSNGTLVEEGRASGGEYKWYGQDKHMKRVASGVYMVEVATAEGDKGVVCKVVIEN